MTRRAAKRSAAITMAAAMLALGAPALADEFPKPKVDFSADSMTKISGMNPPATPGAAPGEAHKPMEITGKMYASGEKTRQEVSMGGMSSVVINRADKKVVWTLMPATQSYMEFSFDDPKLGKKGMDSMTKSADAKLEKVGSEDVNGMSTTKNKVTVKAPDGKEMTGHVWLTKDNIPMRMIVSPAPDSQITMELKNVKVAKQDAALFEVPQGYNKMQMPDISALTGGAPGAPGAAPGAPGAPGGKPPQISPEQMKQLQEQIRKQMEQMQKNMPKQPTAPAAP